MTVQIDPCKSYLAKTIVSFLNSVPSTEPINISEQDVFGMLEKPPQEGMGDFALPCFRFAKALKIAPPKIAADLAESLKNDASGWITKASTINAFCNIYINKNMMASAVIPNVLSGKLFDQPLAPKNSRARVMIEYSQPNTHKEFHVGHIRNVCLGSCLVKLFRYCGYNVIAANYFGDEGTHIAKCLWMMKRLGARPGPNDDKGAWLGDVYVQATKTLDESTAEQRANYDKEISMVLAGIESKTGIWFELWQETRQWSLDGTF